MRTKIFLSLIIVMMMAVTASAGDKKNNYTGQWNFNKEKNTQENRQLFLAKISFRVANDSVFMVRVYENANGEQYPFNENLSTDGKESQIVIYDMPRKAKAYWSQQDGNLIIESTTTFTGNAGEDNLIAKETWKVDESGAQLSVDFITRLSSGESQGTLYFKKNE